MRVGAWLKRSGVCEFTVWAPFARSITLHILSDPCRYVSMSCKEGYWRCTAGGIAPGTEYRYRIDDVGEYPDPASFYQPKGPHGPSCVVSHDAFSWTDAAWKMVPFNALIIYELHTGAFTQEGTFAAAAGKLLHLKELGITAVELMPVAQFAGSRNWGYDGTYPFAVQDSYGGPEGLKMFIDAAHRQGISVILDVVYNHFGPEGSYIRRFGPYGTSRYHTPWGDAVNFDGTHSRPVRDFFIQNAVYWLKEFHVDGLRLDAVHGIFDMSPKHILQELAEQVKTFSSEYGRGAFLIAESDLNDTRLIREKEEGGWGLDAQWCDDFHHSIHALLTGERDGYYADFGSPQALAKALREGFVYSGQYSSYRKRRHGSPSHDIAPGKFVVFIQNHDQVGNRLFGDRLSSCISPDALKLAAGALLSSPYIPLIFMGEEFAEDAPFCYFTSHTDEKVIEAVRKGRKEEFSSFKWSAQPPDPQAQETFRRSILGWHKLDDKTHKAMYDYYRELIALRKEHAALGVLAREDSTVQEYDSFFVMKRSCREEKCIVLMNFSDSKRSFTAKEQAVKIFSSDDPRWLGTGSGAPDIIRVGSQYLFSPYIFVIYRVKENV